MSRFILNQTHPLIPREQNFVLERKIISIHSYDRDISKWPNANHFEIDLPEDLINVQSLRLATITLPNNQYVFTNAYQNIKLIFDVSGVTTTTYTITITEGSYTAEQLAIEISTKMNKAVEGFPSGTTPYNHFICKYNPVSNTFWFGNDLHKFNLRFELNPGYTIPCGQPEVWTHYTKWGLPSYLGYDKKIYAAHCDSSGGLGTVDASGGFGFDFETTQWLPAIDASNVYYVKDPSCNLDLFGEETIYMEIEKRNSIDELEPYSENTMGMYNNDYSGKVDSAFAKIPIGLANAFSLYGDNRHYYLMNTSTFSPPIDRLTRLRFTFRFHDGRLVDFKCLHFNFSLEFNIIRDEQRRKMNLRVPEQFS